MKKFNEFDYSYLIRDKTRNINTYCKFMLCKSQGMFVYDGLPDSMPAMELERILQTTGNVTITEINGDLYCFAGQLHGEHLSPYMRPQLSTVTNVALNISREFTNKKDCVIAYNDSYGLGVAPIFAKYGYMLCENRITQYNILVLTRAQQLFSASDSNTVASAQTFIKKLVDGELSVIAENAFFDGLKTHNDNANIAGNLKTLIEFEQYIKASCLNEIGLNANFNMKREALNSAETGLNEQALLPFPIDMLNNRKSMCNDINELFGSNITVSLNPIWSCEDENSEPDSPDNSGGEIVSEDGGNIAEVQTSVEPETEQIEQTETESEDSETEPLSEVDNGQDNDDDVSTGPDRENDEQKD